MPKRKTTQNKKRKNKKIRNSNNSNNSNNTNNSNYNDIDFDNLIETQIHNDNKNNNSNVSIIDIKNKIKEIEESKKRDQNIKFFSKNVILKEMNIMKDEYNKTNDNILHINNLYEFITKINDIFYYVLDCESNLKINLKNLLQQNETLKRLCKKLQQDKKILSQNIKEIEDREKKWRNDIEYKFENSLSDIRNKIGDHEDRYNLVIEENKKLREQLNTYLEYDKKRTSDFELYKSHQNKLDEIHLAEKKNFNEMIEKERQQTIKLSKNLKQAIEINDLLKERCNQYEIKFNQMNKTVKESSNCIDEYKKMNIQLMKQNKSLHNKLNDIMNKYKQLNSYNDTLNLKNNKL
eukprot:488725_1